MDTTKNNASFLEEKVFGQIQHDLKGTNLYAIYAFKDPRFKGRSYVPDILICKGDAILSILEVKSKRAFSSRTGFVDLTKKYREAYQKVFPSVLFAITDGEQVYYETKATEVVASYSFYVSLLQMEDSSPYMVSTPTSRKYVSGIIKLVRENVVLNKDLLQWFVEKRDEDLFEENGLTVRFRSVDLENLFFLKLLGQVEDEELCRYTSLDSLFTILNEKQQNLCSIVCMNDKGELTYVDDEVSIPFQTIPDDPNNCFILSLLPIKHEDDLTFWRLYGSDASGTCITYKVVSDINTANYPGFYLAKVSYQKANGTHPELNIIKQLASTGIAGKVFAFRNWVIWKHFFKSKHFSIEDEVRLLFLPTDSSSTKSKWIKNETNQIVSRMLLFDLENSSRARVSFPLSITKVLLGPKNNPDIVEQYDYMRSHTLSTITHLLPSSIEDIYR